MAERFLKLCLIVLGALLVIHTGGPIMAGDSATNVEVFVDLDGDGFDDNESDVNKDGVPDLVCPVAGPKMLASTADIFSGQPRITAPVVKTSNAQKFGLRKFSIRALMVNRAGMKNGFPDEKSSGMASGSAACPGGACGGI